MHLRDRKTLLFTASALSLALGVKDISLKGAWDADPG